jgi:hypothetical protein
MGEMRKSYTVLVEKREGKSLLEITRCRIEDNIKMDLKDKGNEGVDWINLSQVMVQWRVLVSALIKPLVSLKTRGIS